MPKARSVPNMSRRSPRRSPGSDAGLLRALAGELHESDVGDLIEALDPELRPKLIELLGEDFDFTALTEVDDTVREEILEELRRRDRRRGRARPRFRRCGLHPGRPAEGRAGRNPRAAVAARARRAGPPPRLPGGIRRAAHADRVHRGAAELDRRADHRLHARDRGSAGALLRNLRRRRRTANSSARCRSTG